MNRSTRFLPTLLALAAVVALGGSARADLPPSPLIKLNSPVGGAVVPATPGNPLTFSFTVDWAKINEKYKKWGGAANLFMAIGMHTDSPGAGLFFGDFLAPNQSTKTWTVSDILAAMAKEGIPANKRIYWDVIIRPHDTMDPDTTDRTEASFGFGPAATPTPLVMSVQPGGLALKPTATPVLARSGGSGLQLVKAATAIRLGDLVTRRVGPTPGPHITVTLVRASDHQALALPVRVSVNGGPTVVIAGNDSDLALPDLRAGQTTWKVQAAFDGNDAYAPSSDTKTYTKP